MNVSFADKPKAGIADRPITCSRQLTLNRNKKIVRGDSIWAWYWGWLRRRTTIERGAGRSCFVDSRRHWGNRTLFAHGWSNWSQRWRSGCWSHGGWWSSDGGCYWASLGNVLYWSTGRRCAASCYRLVVVRQTVTCNGLIVATLNIRGHRRLLCFECVRRLLG